MLRPRCFTGLFLAALICLGFTLAPLSAQESDSLKADAVPSANYGTTLEKQTFALINQYRKENDLPPFKWSDDITQVALGHSKDMATGQSDFGHEGFSKRVTVLKAEMVGLKGAGENVLRTNDPKDVAEAAVRVWLHSPHHLANIRGDFNYSGVGVWRDDKGMIYFTQFFVKLVPPTDAPQAAQATPPTALVTPFVYLAKPTTR